MHIEVMPVGPIATNCYLISDGAVCAIIDPGEEARRIADKIDAMGCTPGAILLTHSHFDHTGAVEDLRKFYPGLPVYRSDRDIYHNDRQMLQIYPELGETLSCDEGDTIEVGQLRFTVLATPGHTEGSLTFRCENALFCGDTLFAGSCGRTDLAGGDQNKMWASLRRLGNLPEDLEVYPGHMNPSTLSQERSANRYLQHALRGGL